MNAAARSTGSGRVPVSWGSPRFRTREVGPFEVTDAFFPPSAVLAGHTHDRTVVAVILSGAIESRLRGRAVLGRPDEVWTEPAGEVHANRVGPDGARVLVIQPDPTREEWLDAARPLLDGIHHFRNRTAAHLARCILPELGTLGGPDALMIEGLALQILSVGVRRTAGGSRAPEWLTRALDMIHDGFRSRLTVAAVAEEVGLHPGYFGRAFKERTGQTVGRYVRRLRLDWAASRLRATDDPIGRIALQACFADQSHFTREFRLHTGDTPARYRDARQPAGNRQPGAAPSEESR